MRAVIQRVSGATVSIENKNRSSIGTGLLLLLGIEEADNQEDIDWLANKIVQLRIFNDGSGTMNLSVVDAGGEILVVSQFTLHAKTKKGNRPSYIRAAPPDIAIPLYEQFLLTLERKMPGRISSGTFGAVMNISLINTGPVTILLDTKNKE